MEKECEHYEEEVQPYWKTDYKPIIYNDIIILLFLRGKSWVREHCHLLTRVKGLGSAMVIYLIEKTNGVNFSKRPTLKDTNSPILSMLAINCNRVFCALHSRM